jgi:glucose uptake protein GlcU
VASLLARLVRVTSYGAVLPWLIGMIIAALERLRRRRAI